MRIFSTTVVYYTLILFSSCSNLNKNDGIKNYNIEVININPQDATEKVLLSEFVDSVKFIKIQTDANCIIGRHPITIIASKYIYFADVDQQIVFLFDKTGKYIAKLDKSGRGPDEYQFIGGLFVDEDENYIEIVTDSKLLKYSNIQFELLSERPIPSISANSMRKYENAYYYATNQMDNFIDDKHTNAGILIEKEGNVNALFDENMDTNHISFIPFTESFTLNDENKLFYTGMYDNTFYHLHNMNAVPMMTVNFGKYGISKLLVNKSVKEQMDYIKSARDIAFFPRLNINNSHVKSITYNWKSKKTGGSFSTYQYLELKHTNKVIHTQIIKNDITVFPKTVDLSNESGDTNHESWHNEYLLSIVEPASQFYGVTTDSLFVDGIGRVTPQDNPIIMLMKLKQ